MKAVYTIALLFCAVALFGGAQAAVNSDLITNLPGLGPVSYKQYSGYLDISSDKHLFYWFIESENDPSNDPVVVRIF